MRNKAPAPPGTSGGEGRGRGKPGARVLRAGDRGVEGLGCVPSGQGAGVFSVQSSPGEAHVCELSGVTSLASEPRDRISGVSPGGSAGWRGALSKACRTDSAPRRPCSGLKSVPPRPTKSMPAWKLRTQS